MFLFCSHSLGGCSKLHFYACLTYTYFVLLSVCYFITADSHGSMPHMRATFLLILSCNDKMSSVGE